MDSIPWRIFGGNRISFIFLATTHYNCIKRYSTFLRKVEY